VRQGREGKPMIFLTFASLAVSIQMIDHAMAMMIDHAMAMQ
jgi:hypothetical protein